MFRFTIRDVLWLTVVAALAVAWSTDRDRIWKQAEHNRTVVDGFRAIGVNLESELKKLQASPPPIRPVMQFRPGPPRITPGSSSDYQFPPRPPLRISDQERP